MSQISQTQKLTRSGRTYGSPQPTPKHPKSPKPSTSGPKRIKIPTTKEQFGVPESERPTEAERSFHTDDSILLYDFRNEYNGPVGGVKLTKMLLSYFIREQPEWDQNLENKKTIAKWVQDFKSQGRNVEKIGIDRIMIKYVVDELRYFAKKWNGPIQIGPVQGTFQSDSLVGSELKNKLMKNVSILENSISIKDWNDPDQIVWNLLHPSMYCLVKGKSRVLNVPDRPNVEEKNRANLLIFHPEEDFLSLKDGDWVGFCHRRFRKVQGDDYSSSKKYQWLPSEFQISEDYSVRISSYINNLHPEDHPGLYSVIEEIFQQFVPMMEKVCPIESGRRRHRITDINFSHVNEDAYKCTDHGVKLAGKTVQVITRLTNYELTPENPEYTGGHFHSEGMSNENIIVSGIYYYHSENITESRLELQHATVDTQTQMEKVGSFLTKEGRCIAFSNKLEHRVAPFRLLDPTKNGYRKVLVFFLINPKVPVLSTAHVPPQQRAWFMKEVLKGPVCLPEEIVNMIIRKCEMYMGTQEATKHRNRIKRERKSSLPAGRGCTQIRRRVLD